MVTSDKWHIGMLPLRPDGVRCTFKKRCPPTSIDTIRRSRDTTDGGAGARGGNTHNADEYLEIDTAVAAAKSLLLFVCRWCGVAG